MSGINSIYILDKKGRAVISRNYRGGQQLNIQESFRHMLIEYDEYSLRPVTRDKSGLIYIFMREADLIFVATTETNTNCVLIFYFLEQFIQVLTTYLKNVEEESVRDNFVLIYELLDEMMDLGYPQITEYQILKDYIKSDYHSLDASEIQPEELSISKTLSSAVSWRMGNIFYHRNEFFLDVTESINMIIGPKGSVIQCEVLGQLICRSRLSGMPELVLGLNDKALFEAQSRSTHGRRVVSFDDIKFHQCVRLGKFETERVISFVPPDGQFELASYRQDISVKPIFVVNVLIERPSTTRIRFIVSAKANYKPKIVAHDVDIIIPVPDDAENAQFNCGHGITQYSPDDNAMIWSMKRVSGQRQLSLTASFNLPRLASASRDRFLQKPIEAKFEIPYFTASGLLVRYLKVKEASGYKAMPWVKYLTKNGSF